MTPLNRHNKCDGCGEPFVHKEQVVALIPFVEVEEHSLDQEQIRLKLSLDSIDTRALKVFCQKCINLNNFIVFDLPGV